MSGDIVLTNTPQFVAEVERLAKKYGINVKDMMRSEFRLLIQWYIKNIEPKQRSKGRRAVKNDLNKIFQPMQTVAALRFFKKIAEERGDVAPHVFNLAVTEFGRWHEQHRDPFSGRVKGRMGGSYKIGGVLFHSTKAYVRKSDLNRYVRKKQANVGRLKAGFVPAVKKVGGKAPGWVEKQGKREGSFKDRMKNTGDGHLEGTNWVPYASRKIKRSTMEAGVRVRQAGVKKNLERTIKKVAAEFNRSG